MSHQDTDFLRKEDRRFITLELEFEEAEAVLKDLEDRWNHPVVDRMIRLLRRQLEFKE